MGAGSQAAGAWSDNFPYNAIAGDVYALAVWDPDGDGPEPAMLCVGGSFYYAGGKPVNNVICWNGTTWLPMGGGLPGQVSALAVHGNALYAGGSFRIPKAGGGYSYSIARWDPAGGQWQPVGDGLACTSASGSVTPGYVYALIEYEGSLYAGGHFYAQTDQNAYTGSAIARLDAGTGVEVWQPVGEGLTCINANGSVTPGYVHALAVHEGRLYAGGQFFTQVRDATTGQYSYTGSAVACYDPADGQWQPVGEGLTCINAGGSVTPGYVYALMEYEGRLYAGGYFFTQTRDASTGQYSYAASAIARLDTGTGAQVWQPVGSGLDRAYASGFAEAGSVYAMAEYEGCLYIGGYFFRQVRDADTGQYSYIDSGFARLDTSTGTDVWQPVGGGVGQDVKPTGGFNLPGRVLAMRCHTDEAGPGLFVGGAFTAAGTVLSGRIARWGAGNATPEVSEGAGVTGNEGRELTVVAAYSDADAAQTHTAEIDWGDGTTSGALVDPTTGTVTGTHTYADDGTYTVTVIVTDSAGASGSGTLAIQIMNEAPTIEAGRNQAIVPNVSTLTVNATFADPGTGDTHMAWIDWGDGSPVEAGRVDQASGAGTITGSHVYAAFGTYTVTVTVADDDGGVASDAFEVVANTPPTLTITSPSSGYVHPVGGVLYLTATITDPDLTHGDHYTATWTLTDAYWGNLSPQVVVVGGTVSGSIMLPGAGVYAMTASVTDSLGVTATASCVNNDPAMPATVVVCDPAGAFVTGQASFESPANALEWEPNVPSILTGKVVLNLVAKYQKKGETPQGNLQLHVGKFQFKSTEYQWLVVSGTRVVCQGWGTLRDLDGTLAFRLTAVDEAAGDRFRIRIWDEQTGHVIYDTNRGQPDDAGSMLGGADIVIHNK